MSTTEHVSCYKDTMQFVFKRDEEGYEHIHVGDVCIAVLSHHVKGRVDVIPATIAGLQEQHVHDAIERADEAGFWEACNTCQGHDCGRRYDEVTVDVPVAETSTTLTLVREDD